MGEQAYRGRRQDGGSGRPVPPVRIERTAEGDTVLRLSDGTVVTVRGVAPPG